MSRFFATGSDSNFDTSSEEEIIQRPLSPVYTFSDDEEEVKRVVRSTKEKRYEQLPNLKKEIRNLKKDMSSMLSSFEDLQKAYDKALLDIQKEESGQTPRFYTPCLVELEDFIIEMQEDRKNLGRSLTSMRQKLRKYVKEFEEDLTKFRANPDTPDDVEEEKKHVVSITAARSRLINDSATVSFHTRFRMAQSHLTNGYTNGHILDDIEDGSDFLFASESVENTPIRMLVLSANGDDCLLDFPLSENYTTPEILERAGLPFHPDSKIECTETNHPGVNYLVTVGRQHLENNTNDDTPDPEELDSQANTQKADFALSTETTSETATSEPLAETETPRFVAGLLAVCNHCGYTTENFNRCPRCRNKLPDDVKTRPALKRASGINNKLANGPNKKKPKIIEQEPVVLTSSSGEEEEEEESYTNKLSETDQLIRRLSNSSVTLSAIKKEPSMSDIQQNPSSELDDAFIAVRGLYQSLQRYLDTLTRASQVGRPKTEPPPSLDGHPSL